MAFDIFQGKESKEIAIIPARRARWIVSDDDLIAPMYEPYRQNRWILYYGSSSLEREQTVYEIMNININYISNQLFFCIIESIAPNNVQSIIRLFNENPRTLYFTIGYLDPAGIVLRRETFNELMLMGHEVFLDYAGQEFLTHSLVINYNRMVSEFN